MSDIDIAYLSAAEAIERFKAKTLSPVELMDAVIARAEATEPTVNAITERYFAGARVAAKMAEVAYRASDAPRPLEGIPLAVKEADRLAGTKRPNGSLVYKDRVDTETSPVTQRLLDAGAIPHMKTTVPEFCILGATHSRIYGVTRNPWNPDFGPGGSSGGSAVVLATGGATMATGSDIGGSIRIPASTCGVAGYKAPYGRNPAPAGSNLDSYCHFGILARSVGDLAIGQNVISGRHPRDITSLADKVIVPVTGADNLKGKKIAWSMTLGAYEIDNSVVKATMVALDVLRGLGAEVVEVDLDWTPDIIKAAEAYLAHGWGNSMAENFERDRPYLTEYAIDYIERAAKTTPADYHFARDVEGRMYDSYGPLMEGFDAFICPTLSVPSVPAEFLPMKTPVTVNGKARLMSDDDWAMTTPFNTLSRLPVLSVPSGFGVGGVPTGIQIVGKAYDDISVFEVGLAYEKAAPWLTPGHRPLI